MVLTMLTNADISTTTQDTWNITAVRRLEGLFRHIEAAVAYAVETNRILSGAPLR